MNERTFWERTRIEEWDKKELPDCDGVKWYMENEKHLEIPEQENGMGNIAFSRGRGDEQRFEVVRRDGMLMHSVVGGTRQPGEELGFTVVNATMERYERTK